MGRIKIDTSKKIQDAHRKGIIFSKRKRGFLKKAIELGRLCGFDIFIVMKEQDRNKVV